MENIVPVNPKSHAGKKLLPLPSFAFTADINLVPVIATEFAAAARFFPLVFHKIKDEIGVYCLLGLLNKKNFFVDKNGRWLADYVPATFRRYPFVIAKVPDEEKFVLCIDESSGLLSEEKGTPLFDENGKGNKILDNALAFVTEYQRGVVFSQAFCKEMERLELLAPLKVELKSDQEKNVNIEGLLCIDEKKFNALDDEAYVALRKKGIMPLIYAHLLSLGNISVLAQLMKKPVAKTAVAPAPVVPKTFNF